MSGYEKRLYSRDTSVVFKKTKDAFGSLSNMAPGFPLFINGNRILTSEALYQACRFPHLPDVQMEIVGQKSPMTAKMKSKPHRKNSRSDWDDCRIKIMRWCLRIKLYQNWVTFSQELKKTGNLLIVEESQKDSFWGAIPDDDNNLFGTNALGRLLMELRGEAEQINDEVVVINPPNIDNFLLFNEPIGSTKCILDKQKISSKTDEADKGNIKQTRLFD